MENPGEHLVGQYLRHLKNCDFVEYNLQTIFKQGEIDVVGIDSAKKQIYICEVATHLETGIYYQKNGKVDNVERFKSKFTKNIGYSKQNFQEYECHYML
jgi:Holliday junction resolvase-like predicted endonuclease